MREERKRKAGRIIRHVTSAAAASKPQPFSLAALNARLLVTKAPWLWNHAHSWDIRREALKGSTHRSQQILYFSSKTSEDIFTVPNSRGGPINQALGVEQVSFFHLPVTFSSPVCFSSFCRNVIYDQYDMNFKFDSFCLIKYSSLEKERKNALAIGRGAMSLSYMEKRCHRGFFFLLRQKCFRGQPLPPRVVFTHERSEGSNWDPRG